MDELDFTSIINRFDKAEIFNYMIRLNGHLPREQNLDYGLYLDQLTDLIKKFDVPAPTKKNKGKESPETDVEKLSDKLSLNIFKLVSRNLVLIFHHLPTKVYDFTNSLLNYLQIDANEVTPLMQISIVILIDLFETFPNSLSSLINFSVTQIYKIIKKSPEIDSSLVYLLNSITKNATKLDIDEKFQAKLIKIVTKTITQVVTYELDSMDESFTILLKKNYILSFKNLLLLSVSSNYERLLALSASSSGSKMKPETIMSQQNTFQTGLLATHEKTLNYCLSNYSQEVRITAIELLANLFINFIPTGKFSAIEYLISQYPLPGFNNWDLKLDGLIDAEDSAGKDKSSLSDSQSFINTYTNCLLFQTSIVETFIFYLQLEQFQNPEFLSNNLIFILDNILSKFGELNQVSNHIQNQHWNKVLLQWSKVFDFIINECGSSCHETLTGYVYAKFNHQESTETQTRLKKKESTIFGFKGKSLKSKTSGDMQVKPYHNSYQAYLLLQIVELLLPFGINFNSMIEMKDVGYERSKIGGEVSKKSTEASDTIEESKKSTDESANKSDIDEEGTEISQESFIKDILFKLVINDNSYIRNYSLSTMLKYGKNNEAEINLLILQAFKSVNQEFKEKEKNFKPTDENISYSTSVKLLNYSLLLLSLIKQTDSTLIQNSTIVKILSFCTQNLKHNNSNNHANFLKNSSCWVILSSLVTFYNESEFIKLNSSQFLVFWKSLLTSQFISSSISSKEEQTGEIIGNLKVRNFSLICLFNYIQSVELTPESIKQLQFLLTKSYNYLTYLESNIEGIGSITNFNQNFNVQNYNPNLVNNIQFSNYCDGNLTFTKTIISLILYSKKLILQSFIKLSSLLKNDINSNMVIFLLKVFSDSKIFCRLTSQEEKSKKKVIIEDFDDDIILSEDYFSFGVTSKFRENLDKKESNNDRDIFPSQSKLSLWIDYFEHLLFGSDHSINYDPIVYLLSNDNKQSSDYATPLITSLVDLSIELFQLVFPCLSYQIQFSLLEQMRNSLTAKSIDPLRYKAIQVNISITLYGLLKNVTKNIEKDITLVILDILGKIEYRNKFLVEINSDSFGKAMKFLPKATTTEYINKYVNEIVNDSNPYKRGYSVLLLSKLYKESHVGFNEIYNVIFQLLNDPNPIVYFYSLKSVTILFESNLESVILIPKLLDKIHANYLNDNFGYDLKSNVLINLRCKFNYMGLVGELLRLFVTSLGPSLREWKEHDKIMLKNLIISLSYGIGLTTIRDYEVYNDLLTLFQELIIFDPDLIEGEVKFFTELLNLIISKNLKIGLTTTSPTSLNKDSIFPFNTSFQLYKAGYECYVELIKIFGVEILTKETVNLLWISMNLKPCDELKQFIQIWLESSLEMNWFVTLNSLFKVSSKKLIGPFIEQNYQQKLLPMLQRQRKKNINIDFKDEEIENIVGDDEGEDKIEPITWEFKLFIYDLLNHLLELASKNSQLVDKLKLKIQDIVKVSFLGSTSPITSIKIRGINLLDKALDLFGNLPDPLYPEISILEQQQAQIISALMPCFNSDSDAKVIVEAINVSSKFINLPRIKFYSKQRILNTLIYLLEEVSSNKFLKFGYLENMSEFERKSIQLSILNCWAILKLDIENQDTSQDTGENLQEVLNTSSLESSTDIELQVTLNKYSKLLTSLWILVLREFSSLKFSDSSSKELEIYGNYWINFIRVLSVQLEKDPKSIDQYLLDDAQNFFFVLFSQCVESLIKNRNVSEILITMNRLVKSTELVKFLFNDEIFGEVVDLFDRLIMIDEDIEVQVELMEIVKTIFDTYIKNVREEDQIESGFDKLFELIRVGMLPLFNILPFLRSDFDSTNDYQKLLLKQIDSGPNLLVLKKSLENLIDMMSKFPDIVKVDLYSCLLFIFSKIYQEKNELLISIILPHLKQIIGEARNLEGELVPTFSKVIQGYFTINREDKFTVITAMILVTSGGTHLSEKQSSDFANALIGLLEKEDTIPIAIQCIKSLNLYSLSMKESLFVNKQMITKLIQLLNEEDSAIDPKLAFEILFLFSKLFDVESKLVAFYSIIIPLLLRYNESDVISKSYLHQRLLFLVNKNSNSFKVVVNTSLSNDQKLLTEELVKLNLGGGDEEVSLHDHLEIELKKFGE